MNWLTYTGIVAGVFLFMKGVSWATNKYIVHGFLWYLHEDHHKKGPFISTVLKLYNYKPVSIFYTVK
jgi:hypothetical protein